MLAMVMLIVAIWISGFNVANAGILDWFSGTENRVVPSAPKFGFISSFLSANDQIALNDQANAGNLPVIQNNSLVSAASPAISKAVAEIKNIPAKTRELIVLVTAYSSTPDQTDDTPFITAKGTYVRDGIVAANFLPFGTKVRMPEIYGDKIFVVEDRMNRRYWHVVDIWFPDRASALEFGVKRVKIEILES